MFGRRQEDPAIKLHKQDLQINRDKVMTDAALYDDQYYIQNTEERENLTRWQQDLDDDLKSLYYDLLNWTKGVDGKWKLKSFWVGYDDNGQPVYEYGRPSMNQLGANWIIGHIKQYLSRNVMNSNLDNEGILRTVRSFGNDLAISMAVNYDTWDVDMSIYPAINSKIRHMIYFTLLRALNDGERRHQESQRKFIEAITTRPEDEAKKSLLNPFGGAKW